MQGINAWLVTGLLILSSPTANSQNTGSTWKRSTNESAAPLALFHSTQVFSLPTAEMLTKGTFEFEISHRFYPPIKGGQRELFGLDGPATIRFALAYGISDRLTVSLGRSNLDDNVDLNLKYRALESGKSPLPVLVSIQAGTGWNTRVPGLSSSDSRSFQYYARVIINTMIRKKVGLGLAPTYLYNTDVRSENTDDIVALGVYGQYYLSRLFSVLVEWNPVFGRADNRHNPVSYGMELGTGGHFFKILASNSTRLNPSQYTAGSDDPAGGRYWHLGFNITRLLRFW
jgi:hypothetical protein